MKTKIAISGMGRIGRLVLRGIIESKRKDIKIVALNDLSDVETIAHLLKYDSVHGIWQQNIKTTKSTIDVGQGAIKIFSARDPKALPWRKLGIDVVMECTGAFTSKEKAQTHIDAGAKKVLISAPATGADITLVYGVNHKELKPTHRVISNASCTTNAVAPIAQVLDDKFGITKAYMTTIHAYTGDQRLADSFHKDKRRARAAALSIIPTSTGAARAVGLVLPKLKGKIDGTAIRVPTPNVSVIDLVALTKRKTTPQEVNQALKQAARGKLKHILGINQEPLISVDFNKSPYSSICDLTQTQIVGDNLVRILSWYDNEWGFSLRMADSAVLAGQLKE